MRRGRLAAATLLNRVSMKILLTWALAALACLPGCSKAPEPGWSGYVEGEYLYLAAPVAGRLTSLSATRGQRVTQGAALFALDADNERAASDEAAARATAARAAVANIASGKRVDELAMVQAQLAQAQAQAALAASELQRHQQLFAQGFVTIAHVDDARSAAGQTQARVDELRAALRVARLPARDDERRAASANAAAAEQALAQAHWRQAQRQQTAPREALVSDTFFRVGEWVAAGQPVLALLPSGALKARFFVPERELATLRIGQAVSLGCDGCAGAIAARVDFIATQAEYTPPVIYSNAQRSRLVFMVEARPEAADAGKLKPGQPVDVRLAGPS